VLHQVGGKAGDVLLMHPWLVTAPFSSHCFLDNVRYFSAKFEFGFGSLHQLIWAFVKYCYHQPGRDVGLKPGLKQAYPLRNNQLQRDAKADGQRHGSSEACGVLDWRGIGTKALDGHATAAGRGLRPLRASGGAERAPRASVGASKACGVLNWRGAGTQAIDGHVIASFGASEACRCTQPEIGAHLPATVRLKPMLKP
jgi:hypothetical protein